MSSETRDEVIALQAGRLRELLKWRRYTGILLEAVEKVLGTAEIYVFGSVVEGRLTVDSDIDLLVIVDHVPKKGLERARILDAVWRVMEEKGVPWWYPFEIHLATRDELQMLVKGGAKLVAIKPQKHAA